MYMYIGTYLLCAKFPESYPSEPPEFRFITPVSMCVVCVSGVCVFLCVCVCVCCVCVCQGRDLENCRGGSQSQKQGVWGASPPPRC